MARAGVKVLGVMLGQVPPVVTGEAGVGGGDVCMNERACVRAKGGLMESRPGLSQAPSCSA